MYKNVPPNERKSRKTKFRIGRVTHRHLLFIEHSNKKKIPPQNQSIEEWIWKEHKPSNFARVAMIQQKTTNSEHEPKTSQNNHSTQEKTSNDKRGQR